MYHHERENLEKELQLHVNLGQGLMGLATIFLGAALFGFGVDIFQGQLTYVTITATIMLMGHVGCVQLAERILNKKIKPLVEKLYPEAVKKEDEK